MTAIGGRPKHEISYRGVWGEHTCPKSVTIIHSVVGDPTTNLPIERRAALHKIQIICECWSALASRYKYHKRKIRFHSLAPIAWTDWQDHTFRDHFYSMYLENVIQRWQNPNRDDELQWGFLSMKLAPYRDSSFDSYLVELEECSACASCMSGGRPRSPSGFTSCFFVFKTLWCRWCHS